MEKVVRNELVSEIVSDDDLAADTPQPRYRRFRDRASLFLTAFCLSESFTRSRAGSLRFLTSTQCGERPAR